MMGRQSSDQSRLFYLFDLERRIPADHLLRRIDPVVTRILGDLREKLEQFYSENCRPSIDPELMIRMLSDHAMSARRSRCDLRTSKPITASSDCA
jgi:transposase